MLKCVHTEVIIYLPHDSCNFDGALMYVCIEMLLRKYILTVFMHDHFVSIFSSGFIIQPYPPFF